MRYQTADKVGKCVDLVLLNCTMSLDEIVAKMKLKGRTGRLVKDYAISIQVLFVFI